RSTLSDANKRRSSMVFEKIYYELLNLYEPLLSDSQTKGRLDNRLFIVDSTTISLFQEILKGAGQSPVNGKRKGGIKAHVLVRADQDVPCLVTMTKASARDTLFLKKIQLPENSILVFDRGYVSYSEFERFSKENCTWVTRKNLKA